MPQKVSVELSADRASAREARRTVGDTLASWGWEDVVDDAVLLVSELVTNAVLHANSSIALVILGTEGRLRIEVHDGGAGSPALRHFSPTAGTGRGLQLVGMLSTAWGVEPRADGGKAVWFELDRAPAVADGATQGAW